jgi:uncharacterized protein (TIGR02147 family)
MNQFTIYHFNDPRDFLSEVYEQKKAKNPGFSVRAWAKQIGLNSHAMLAHTLTKKRKLKAPFAAQMRDHIGLRGPEARYFDLLVACSSSSTIQEKQFYEDLLLGLRPKNATYAELSHDVLRLISQWIHTALLEMVELEDFSVAPEDIASRLRRPIKSGEINQAIERLLRLQLLERESGTGQLKRRHASLKTKDDIPNSYIREHHKQMMEQAKLALEEQTPEEREFRSCALAIRYDRLPEAKRLIRKFMTEFQETVGLQTGEKAEAVYELNLQFFEITKTHKIIKMTKSQELK